ncbi:MULTISPECIES: MBL fold metallo-hydrolase [unclassified Streptomyces]|uniref:MBL fold metallo-hydrolase n=1 Tax=unclassified Streptomyces TaxID=2593676 RepID=UPI00381AB16E
MSPWFEQQPYGDGLIRLTEPHVHEILKANVWWLRGTDRDVVVDTGLGVVTLREEVPALFARDPLAVLSHAHLDHVGGAHEFRERAGHPADAAALAAGVPASLDGPELARLLGAGEVGADFPGRMIDALPGPGYDPAAYRVAPVTLTRPVEDGDRIDLGGRSLTVLHLPGHTPGSVALLEEHTGALYPGDVVYDGYLVDDLPGSDVAAYRRSMEFLCGLDVSVVHPGHGRSFDRARLHDIARTYLRRTAGDGEQPLTAR